MKKGTLILMILLLPTFFVFGSGNPMPMPVELETWGEDFILTTNNSTQYNPLDVMNISLIDQIIDNEYQPLLYCSIKEVITNYPYRNISINAFNFTLNYRYQTRISIRDTWNQYRITFTNEKYTIDGYIPKTDFDPTITITNYENQTIQMRIDYSISYNLFSGSSDNWNWWVDTWEGWLHQVLIIIGSLIVIIHTIYGIKRRQRKNN